MLLKINIYLFKNLSILIQHTNGVFCKLAYLTKRQIFSKMYSTYYSAMTYVSIALKSA